MCVQFDLMKILHAAALRRLIGKIYKAASRFTTHKSFLYTYIVYTKYNVIIIFFILIKAEHHANL